MIETTDSMSPEEVRRIIAANTQKGALYRVRFADESTVYEGIPLALPPIITGQVGAFDFKVVKPADRQGVQRHTVDEVVYMQKHE